MDSLPLPRRCRIPQAAVRAREPPQSRGVCLRRKELRDGEGRGAGGGMPLSHPQSPKEKVAEGNRAPSATSSHKINSG